MSDTVKMENHYCPLQIYERPRMTEAETSKNHELKNGAYLLGQSKPEKSSTALKGGIEIVLWP